MARVISATCPTCGDHHSVIDRGWSSSVGPVITPCAECCKRTSAAAIVVARESSHAAARQLSHDHASTLIDRAEWKVMRSLLVASLSGGEAAYWKLVKKEIES